MTKLGHEECEMCENITLHKFNCDCTDICNVWEVWRAHRSKYIVARQEFKTDSKRNRENDKLIVSADSQKVIMLPRMEQFKTSISTRRLINITFAEVAHDSHNDVNDISNESTDSEFR